MSGETGQYLYSGRGSASCQGAESLQFSMGTVTDTANAVCRVDINGARVFMGEGKGETETLTADGPVGSGRMFRVADVDAELRAGQIPRRDGQSCGIADAGAATPAGGVRSHRKVEGPDGRDVRVESTTARNEEPSAPRPSHCSEAGRDTSVLNPAERTDTLMFRNDHRILDAARAVSNARKAFREASQRRTAATAAAQHLIVNAVIAERAEKSAARADIATGIRRLTAERLTLRQIAEVCGLHAGGIPPIEQHPQDPLRFRPTSRPDPQAGEGEGACRPVRVLSIQSRTV